MMTISKLNFVNNTVAVAWNKLCPREAEMSNVPEEISLQMYF